MTNQDLKSRFSTAVTEFFNTNPLNAFWKKAQNELDFCAQIQGVKVQSTKLCHIEMNAN